MPELASRHGAGIDAMLHYLLVTVGGLFLTSYLALAYFIWRGSWRQTIGPRVASHRTEILLSGYVAYVPVGSIKRGEALVTTGAGGRTVRCGLCHGEDLKGLGPVPGLAGRSPGYVVRQLYAMQQGARYGLGADLMKATVARLNKDDMLSIAAYTASQAP